MESRLPVLQQELGLCLAAGSLLSLVSQLGLETIQLGREHSLRVAPGSLPDKVLGGLILAHGSLPICPGL